jgi:hypothetical protein
MAVGQGEEDRADPGEPVNTIENTMPARYGPCRNKDGSTSGSRPARWRRI